MPRRRDVASADEDPVDEETEETEEVLGERASVERWLRTLERNVAARRRPAAEDGAARPVVSREHEESVQFFSAKAVRLEQHLAAVREEHAEEVKSLKRQLRTTERGKKAAETEATTVTDAATAEVDDLRRPPCPSAAPN